jgi:hypothetical protein
LNLIFLSHENSRKHFKEIIRKWKEKSIIVNIFRILKYSTNSGKLYTLLFPNSGRAYLNVVYC